MPANRFERISNSVSPTALDFGGPPGTTRFERITNAVEPTALHLVPPDELRLEVELNDPAAQPMETAKKLLALSAAVDRLERSLGGGGMDVGELTQDGPTVRVVFRPVQADGAAERLTRVRGSVEGVVPTGIRLRRAG